MTNTISEHLIAELLKDCKNNQDLLVKMDFWQTYIIKL